MPKVIEEGLRLVQDVRLALKLADHDGRPCHVGAEVGCEALLQPCGQLDRDPSTILRTTVEDLRGELLRVTSQPKGTLGGVDARDLHDLPERALSITDLQGSDCRPVSIEEPDLLRIRREVPHQLGRGDLECFAARHVACTLECLPLPYGPLTILVRNHMRRDYQPASRVSTPRRRARVM